MRVSAGERDFYIARSFRRPPIALQGRVLRKEDEFVLRLSLGALPRLRGHLLHLHAIAQPHPAALQDFPEQRLWNAGGCIIAVEPRRARRETKLDRPKRGHWLYRASADRTT